MAGDGWIIGQQLRPRVCENGGGLVHEPVVNVRAQDMLNRCRREMLDGFGFGRGYHHKRHFGTPIVNSVGGI
jgi:hypothetical protein